eukprot:7247709-Ditylum_brightwellii.AAC.1
MALSAPKVVSLSTLALDPVDPEQDNLILLLAPKPNDAQGWEALNQLLTDEHIIKNHPVVVFNHHMLPLPPPAANFHV